jgi:hypothetical protein
MPLFPRAKSADVDASLGLSSRLSSVDRTTSSVSSSSQMVPIEIDIEDDCGPYPISLPPLTPNLVGRTNLMIDCLAMFNKTKVNLPFLASSFFSSYPFFLCFVCLSWFQVLNLHGPPGIGVTTAAIAVGTFMRRKGFARDGLAYIAFGDSVHNASAFMAALRSSLSCLHRVCVLFLFYFVVSCELILFALVLAVPTELL